MRTKAENGPLTRRFSLIEIDLVSAHVGKLIGDQVFADRRRQPSEIKADIEAAILTTDRQGQIRQEH